MIADMTQASKGDALAQDELVAQLTELVRGYQCSQIVACMARLDIAAHLTNGARSSEELAANIGANAAALRRFLRAAAVLGLLEEVAHERFGQTPLGAWLQAPACGPTLRDFAIGLSGPALTRTFEHLTEAVMTGRPVVEDALGTSFYEYLAAHPDERTSFAGAMSDLSRGSAEEIVTNFDVAPFRRIIDVGGGQGVVLRRLLAEAPNACGVLFDRPEVIELAHRVATDTNGLNERMEFVGGDFFADVPAGGDLYVLREVLHNWDDARVVRILQNCHRAALPGSQLLVVEIVLPAHADPSVGLAFTLDLVSLVAFGGKERTHDEFDELLARAGYRLDRVTAAPSHATPWHVLVAHRL
jgi:hypothetical protein